MDKYILIANVWVSKEANELAEVIFSHLEGEPLRSAVKAFQDAIKPPKSTTPLPSASITQ
jgi:hypothetical protein